MESGRLPRTQVLLSAVKNKSAGYPVAGTLFTEEAKVLRVEGSSQRYLVGSTSFLPLLPQRPPLTHIKAEEKASTAGTQETEALLKIINNGCLLGLSSWAKVAV